MISRNVIAKVVEQAKAHQERAAKLGRFIDPHRWEGVIAPLEAELQKNDAQDLEPVKPLNDEQKVVLDAVLRTLDICDDYILGDALRLAFNVETDQLQTPGRQYTTKDLEDNGFSAFGTDLIGRRYKQRYYVKSLYAKLRKAINQRVGQ